jgi:thioredoxin-related protein
MNHLFRAIASALSLLILSAATVSAAGGWDDDYEKALARAKTEKKLVLLDFTGSDWCGWCIKLEKEVFSKSEFKTYARENLVLVEVDFPQGKRQSAKLKAQNEKLKNEFEIQGYPTLIVLNSEGKKVAQLGYEPGGPKPFVEKLKELQKSE